MLTPAELFEMDRRIGARADRWISEHIKGSRDDSNRAAKSPPKTSNRGRKPKTSKNPFYAYVGPITCYGRYPVFAQDIIEGIAWLDWHARPIEKGGKSMPLSVRKCFVILEVLDEITTAGVQELFGYSQSQAQRYTKAIELAIPFMMRSRPARLIADMNGDFLFQMNPWPDETVAPDPMCSPCFSTTFALLAARMN